MSRGRADFPEQKMGRRKPRARRMEKAAWRNVKSRLKRGGQPSRELRRSW